MAQWPTLSRKRQQHPSLEALPVELGKMAGLEGDLTGALRWHRKAYELNHDSSKTLDGLILALIRTGSSPEAVEVLNGYISRNPSDDRAFTLLGKVYLTLSEHRKAIEAFTNATNHSAIKARLFILWPRHNWRRRIALARYRH